MDPLTFRNTRDSWVERSDLAVSLADPHLPDSPLTLVNPAFCRLTGYDRDACLGRNCRFLQGADTDPRAVARVRDGIAERAFRLTVLRNYRRDGTPFDNALLVGPLTDGADRLSRLFGMQWDLGDTLRRRFDGASGLLDDDREHWRQTDLGRQIRNVEFMVAELVDASRTAGGNALGPSLVERLVALNRPQQYPPDDRLPNWTHADALVRYLIDPYAGGDMPEPTIEADVSVLAADSAAPLGLAVHELSSLTERLARLERDVAEFWIGCTPATLNHIPAVQLRWRICLNARVNAGLLIDDSGLRIVATVLERVGGALSVTPLDGGVEATATVPNRPYALGAESGVDAVPGSSE